MWVGGYAYKSLILNAQPELLRPEFDSGVNDTSFENEHDQARVRTRDLGEPKPDARFCFCSLLFCKSIFAPKNLSQK